MNFLKTYFKTRGLRQITQWLIIAAISILSLSFFAVADAFAAGATSTCNGADLAGTTTAAFPNTDFLDFNDPIVPTSPLFANYQAEICPYVSGSTYLELKGWVWDTNLGWISLYCDAGGLNAGLPCGSYTYGVKINKVDGKMYGWAWGDNIGWISFGCSGGTNDGVACGGIPYGGKTNLIVDATLGSTSGQAWADTVGWFNLAGITSKILPVVVPVSATESNIGIWTKTENNSGAGRDTAPNKKTAPVADGTEGYDIFVNLADFNGNPINGMFGVTWNITPDWNDSVQFDQTLKAGVPGYVDPDTLKTQNSGAVTKPLLGTDFAPATGAKIPSGGSTSAVYSKVLSFAPTDLNCYDGGDDGSCSDTGDFYYKDFGDSVPSQTLEYNGASVTVTIIATGESVTRFLPPVNCGGLACKLDFVPPVELTTFNYLPDPTDLTSGVNYIESFRNKPDYFVIEETNRGAAIIPAPTVKLILSTLSADVNYGWIDSLEQVGAPEPGSDTKEFTEGEENIAMPYAPQTEGMELLGLLEGAKAYSTVEYTSGSNTIKYYSNGVPRIGDSSIINQTAQFLSGQVYSPGAVKVGENVITSIGDLSTNDLRTSILKNVSGLIAGIKSDNLENQDFTFEEGSSYSELADGYAYYYNNANVHITDLSWLSGLGHPVTLIVRGDVYIDTNINSPDCLPVDTCPGYPVGIIVLENDNYTNEIDRGGRIYVHSSVTDLVNVFIYADHAMFRYADDICYFTGAYGPDSNSDGTPDLDGQKEPNFVKNGRCAGNFKEPTTTLVNQFYFKGTIASENCIGCSSLAKVYRGDGKLLGDTTPENFAIGRLFDLNYFAYFRLKPDGNKSGAESATVDQIEIDRVLTDDAMLGPVYFDYASPPKDLAGFSR